MMFVVFMTITSQQLMVMAVQEKLRACYLLKLGGRLE